MIIGIGVDIVRIQRIDKILQKHSLNFAQRILTATEYQLFLRSANPVNFLAKRFAAKEATVKALGCGIGKDCSFLDLETSHTAAGQPQMRYLKADYKLYLSLADDAGLVIAYVLATTNI